MQTAREPGRTAGAGVRSLREMASVRHGWEDWRWDPTLFAGTAEHYVKGRLPYAPRLPDVLATRLDLDGRGRLLDVGCGPGTITLLLAHRFKEVVGLDPDPGMLEEAARQAAALGVDNVTWVASRAEEIPGGVGTFDVITFAASFHWMDRPTVARTVRTLLEPDGAVVQIHAPFPTGGPRPSNDPSPPPPPTTGISGLRQAYLGMDRRAGRGVRNTSPDGEDAVFRQAGFAPAEQVIVPDGRHLERTTDEIVANVLSMSSSAPHLFGDRLDEFERDLRTLLHRASPSGVFSVVLPDNLVTIWRPPPDP